jgi:single-strand DNA-binding protein
MGLNKTIILGRITQDLELKQTPSGIAVLSFTVAVDRNYTKGEEKQSDFISCVAWKERAEFISRYFGKGRMIAVEGQLRTRTYEDKHGSKHYITEVYVDNASFTGESKEREHIHNNPETSYNEKDYEDVLSEDAIPF